MEKFPSKNITRKNEYYESPLGRFEILDLSKIQASDISDEDRAFVYTESGNRYMLRHSQSRNGRLVMYNENNGGFSVENARPFITKSSAIAEVGVPFEYFEISDEKRNMGGWGHSTKVTRIEVRKGLEKAVRAKPEQPSPPETIDLAQTIRNELYGRNKAK